MPSTPTAFAAFISVSIIPCLEFASVHAAGSVNVFDTPADCLHLIETKNCRGPGQWVRYAEAQHFVSALQHGECKEAPEQAEPQE